MPPGRRIASIERRVNRFRRTFRLPGSEKDWHYRRKIPFVRQQAGGFVNDGKLVDFCRGPAELAAAIKDARPCRLSAELGFHVVELTEALQHPERFGGRRQITSQFAIISAIDDQ